MGGEGYDRFQCEGGRATHEEHSPPQATDSPSRTDRYELLGLDCARAWATLVQRFEPDRAPPSEREVHFELTWVDRDGRAQRKELAAGTFSGETSAALRNAFHADGVERVRLHPEANLSHVLVGQVYTFSEKGPKGTPAKRTLTVLAKGPAWVRYEEVHGETTTVQVWNASRVPSGYHPMRPQPPKFPSAKVSGVTFELRVEEDSAGVVVRKTPAEGSMSRFPPYLEKREGDIVSRLISIDPTP